MKQGWTDLQAWPLGRRVAALAAVILIAGSFAIAAVVESAMQLRPPPDRYNIWAWEARNLPAKWLYEAGELFRSSRSLEEQDADIRSFFDLTRRISRLEQDTDANAGELRDLRRQRDALENRVEDSIEARLSEVIEDLGLTRSPWILPAMVWPPVDFEFTDSPRNLVTSPRDRIELRGTELLRADLSIEEVEAIEEQVRRDDNLSALAAPTGGIGAYPTIVDYLGSYESTLSVAAHEWVHNYLAFSPLGFNYYENNDTRTMNETVADLVGEELAAEVLRRWPAQAASQAAPSPSANASPAPSVDLRAELRALRQEVDTLLASGQVEAAEARMAAKRQELEDNGIYIRKLNQAYFAFNNLYAGEDGSPGAVNPIGPKIDELRRLSASLSEFVKRVRGVTSIDELDTAIAGAQQ